MTLQEKKELIYSLGQDYLIEKAKHKVYLRENAQSYTYAQGKLVGACIAFEFDFEETANDLRVFTRNKKIIIAKIENA